MWKRLFPLLLVTSFGYASPLKPHPNYDFSKGLDTYHSSLSLPDGFVHNSINVLFDSQAPVSKVQGFSVAFSSTASAGQTAWTYTDSTNTSWIIERTSAAIIANNLSGSATVLIATVSANNLVGSVNAFGNAYFVDQTQGVYYWNGTATTYVSGSPKGSLITQWHGRVWVSGLAVPNGNQLYGSKQYDGTVWATGLNPNDPVILVVGLQDNLDSVSALYPYLDTLYTFKHFQTYAIYGFDQTNFQISFITSECGCIDQQSIQTYGSSLKFVSERGVETFDGYTCTRISDAVKNLVDPAIQSQGGVNTQSWSQQNTSDWNAGSIKPSLSISTTLASPGLTLQSAATTYNSSLTFGAGTYNGTNWDGSGISLQVVNTNPTNNGFESGNSWWTFFNGYFDGTPFTFPASDSGQSCTINARSGSKFYRYKSSAVSVGITLRALIKHCIDNSVLQETDFSYGENSCTWTQTTISGTGLANKCVFIEIRSDTPGSGFDVLESPNFIASGNNITFWRASDTLTVPTAPYGIVLGLDDFADGVNAISSGTYTSSTLDSGDTNNILLPQATWTVPANANAPQVVFQNSTNGTTWTDFTTSTGSNVSTASRYIRFISTWTQVGNNDITEDLNSVSENTSASSGTFVSQIKNLGSINSFGNFSVQDAFSGGAIAFSVCSSTNSNMSAPTSCASQTPNAQISISTGQYVQWYATFTVTAATQTATLNSGTVQWFSGTRSSPMSSTVWDNRYWLSLTTTTSDTANDAILVLNSKGAWSLLDFKAGGLVQYKNNLYHTDSLASGNVYLDNQGYNENGSAMTALIQTKDYCEEGPTQEDYYESLYPSMDNLGNYNMTISYEMDRDPVQYSLSSVNQSEFLNNTSIKVPFVLNSTNQNFGKCINFTFSESDLNSPWQFYGYTAYYHERPVQ